MRGQSPLEAAAEKVRVAGEEARTAHARHIDLHGKFLTARKEDEQATQRLRDAQDALITLAEGTNP